jgi:Flp pilus assembly protein TadD
MGNLGRAILHQGRAAEAEETFRRALALAQQGGATDDVLGSIEEDLRSVKSAGA